MRVTSSLTMSFLYSIPIDIINGFLGSFDRLAEAGFPQLIELFDGENRGKSSRLDLVSFHCMLHILLRGPPCLARDRGFYLFLVCVFLISTGCALNCSRI